MDSEYILGPNGELYHWGIKGMKWGIRRYQNKDGSLTPAGKKRASENKNTVEDERLDRPRRSGEALSKLSGKKISEITDDERGCFQSDVHAVLTQTYADRISSKNPSDIKEFAEFISDCWKYDMSITDAYVSARDGSNRELISERARKYYDNYIKNDPEAYAKSVIEEIEYRELHHSGVGLDDELDTELYHWGTKGMKWGVRRYQNKDGSLTAAGRKRYAQEQDRLKAREKAIKGREKAAARQAKLDAKKAELDAREAALKKGKKPETEPSNKPKTMRDMSDDELRELTTRMQLEKQYIEAQKNLNAAIPQKVSKGKQFMNSILNDVVAPAAKNAGREWAEKFMKDKLGLNKKDLDPLKKLENDYKKLEWETKLKDLKKAGTLKEPKNPTWDDKTKQQQHEQGKLKTQVAKEKYAQYLKDRQDHIDAGDYEDWIRKYNPNN